ncbi:uncharacterized protein LOC110930616 isoform X3 [Helianthus annuus]|uniref:uncharacterized protein LOC110930616 isoform X3 n=1 Tax=Helianthus annuus TaxID=4232 RepID=UPI000B906870|nr:uncharacterized protein LOC110930616 isoform X3 [Helianthus annuus]XP_022029653.1 uncharacterized protein LOC110930616 isoform X3 [Helianthus annuus]XP_035843734.1 uncharacterized protein LOC110930616 isoform X3 [Helianthus annuus]
MVFFLEQKFDAVVAGDVAIRSSRLDYLDFTQPYNESGDKLHSNFSRMVVVVWLFVALIITQSYTASFTSMLTAQRWKKSRNLLNKNLLDHKVVPSDQTNHTTRATISRQQDHWLQVQPRLIELVRGKQEVVQPRLWLLIVMILQKMSHLLRYQRLFPRLSPYHAPLVMEHFWLLHYICLHTPRV